MPPLDTVYAYRDDRSMGPTRWKARKIFCTENDQHQDAPGQAYVAKFCQGRDGAAAMISEVLCAAMYRAVGVRVLDPVVIHVLPSFAESWNGTSNPDQAIAAGPYFGTRYLHDVMAGPPTSAQQVDSLGDLLDIWVLDSWVCNIDRLVPGNVLLKLGRNQKWQVIASDQSDCFCGASSFGRANWSEGFVARGASEGIFVTEAIAAASGRAGLQVRIEKCRQALQSFGAGVDQVPPEWWERAQIEDPEQIEQALNLRLDRMQQVLSVEHYGEFDYGQFANIPIIEL